MTLVFLSGCSSTIELKKQTFTIELGQDVYGNPSLYIKNPENYAIESMSVNAKDSGVVKKDNRFVTVNQDYLLSGIYDFEIINRDQHVPFKVKIKDTKAPDVVSSPESITVKQGSDIDWDSVFHATDLSGVTYETQTDITQTRGTKQVVVKIMDKYGNAVEKTLAVTVE